MFADVLLAIQVTWPKPSVVCTCEGIQVTCDGYGGLSLDRIEMGIVARRWKCVEDHRWVFLAYQRKCYCFITMLLIWADFDTMYSKEQVYILKWFLQLRLCVYCLLVTVVCVYFVSSSKAYSKPLKQ